MLDLDTQHVPARFADGLDGHGERWPRNQGRWCAYRNMCWIFRTPRAICTCTSVDDLEIWARQEPSHRRSLACMQGYVLDLEDAQSILHFGYFKTREDRAPQQPAPQDRRRVQVSV